MKTLLVLTNFSRKATQAEIAALNIAIATKSDILLFHSVIYPETNPEVFDDMVGDTLLLEGQITQCFNRSIERLMRILDKLSAGSFRPKIKTLQGSGGLGPSVKKIIANNDIWMTVMGSKESDNGLSNFLFGSCAYNVINNINCPVLLVPEKANLQNTRKIALATGISELKSESTNFLADLIKAFSSKLLITHIGSPISSIGKEAYVDSSLSIPLPGLSNSELKDCVSERDFEDLVNESDVDMLVLFHHRNDLFRQIFHSGFTQVLIKFTGVPIMIFPLDERITAN